MTLKARDYMAKLSEIARINALDTYFTKRPKTKLSTEIDFHLIKANKITQIAIWPETCLLYTSPSPRDRTRSRMPSSA